MSYDKVKRRIVGPCTSLVTPLNKDYSLDEKGLRENIRYVLEAGFKEGTGCLLAATPGGESPSLPIHMRKRAMEVIADEAKGKLPIETTAHDCAIDAVVDMMRHAKDVGFDIIQLQPPWYFGTSTKEVLKFYDVVTHKVDIPVVIYNTTWLGLLGGVGLQESTMERLSKLDGIIGIKWSSPSWYTYINCIRLYKDRFSFTDNGYHGLGCFWGCQSFLDVLGQFYPKYPLDQWKLIQKRDYDGVVEHLWKLEIPYYQWIIETEIAGVHGEGSLVKPPMHLAGRPAGPPMPPFELPSDEQMEKLREVLIRGGVPGVKPGEGRHAAGRAGKEVGITRSSDRSEIR